MGYERIVNGLHNGNNRQLRWISRCQLRIGGRFPPRPWQIRAWLP